MTDAATTPAPMLVMGYRSFLQLAYRDLPKGVITDDDVERVVASVSAWMRRDVPRAFHATRIAYYVHMVAYAILSSPAGLPFDAFIELHAWLDDGDLPLSYHEPGVWNGVAGRYIPRRPTRRPLPSLARAAERRAAHQEAACP